MKWTKVIPSTSYLLFRLLACPVWQYLLRVRLKTADRKEATIGPETHLQKIYAFPIAPLTVHTLEKPRRDPGSEQSYFRLIFKLKEEETNTLWSTAKGFFRNVIFMPAYKIFPFHVCFISFQLNTETKSIPLLVCLHFWVII